MYLPWRAMFSALKLELVQLLIAGICVGYSVYVFVCA
jgi:hypothetical protein